MWRYTPMKNDYNYFKNAIVIVERIGESLFMFIITIRTQK